jgi:Calcium binding
MRQRSCDEEREQRITMEIIVDAYTPEEQAMGWYSSLEDRLHFPFAARCITERRISPLFVGDEVEVAGMAPEEECQHEMFVLIRWERRPLRFHWSSWRASRWTSRLARWSRIGTIGSRRGTSCEQRWPRWRDACRVVTPLLGAPCKECV